MDKERIVGTSSNWDQLKEVFYRAGLSISHRTGMEEYISHGIMVIVDGEGLFLQMSHTYEYICIIHGDYTGVKLYHYLSLISHDERMLLLEHPFVQWRRMYPGSNMPGEMYRRLRSLQRYLPILYGMIPVGRHSAFITIPKGRADDGERSVSAALRELHEETGITLQEEDLCGPIIEAFIGTDGNMYTTYIYAAFLKERPTVTLGYEFNGYAWLSSTSSLLLSRQVRILDTFVSNANVGGDNCRRIQQKGTIGYSPPDEGLEEQAGEHEEEPTGKIPGTEGDIQLSSASGDVCAAVQSTGPS